MHICIYSLYTHSPAEDERRAREVERRDEACYIIILHIT